MKIKLTFIVVLFLLANLAPAQVKFRVKKLNADSLLSIIIEKDGTEKIEALNLLSNVICRKNTDSSLTLASQAIELSEELEYQKGLADGYFNTGNVYFLLDSLQPTISNYLKALRIYEDLEPSEEYGNLCMQLSIVNFYTGRFKDNHDYCRQAIHIYERTDDRKGLAMANLGMGAIKYVIYKELDSAIYYCHKALTFLDPAVEPTDVAFVYSEIGRIQSKKFQEYNDTSYLRKALSWYFKGLNLPNIEDDAEAFIYLGMGRASVSLNTDISISNGIEYYNKVIHIANNSFDAYDLKNHAYEMLGWTYFLQEEYEKAIFNFEQAIKIIEERSDVSINDYREPILGYNWKYYQKVNKEDIYRGLYYIYYDHGEYKKALDCYALSKEAEKEIYLEKNQEMVTMMESISEEEKTEKQMAILARDNEMNKLKVAQSRIYVIAMGGVVLILVLVTILFIRQRKTRQIIREQKLLHDLELKNMESEKLKELDHLKSRFFANISHEFRTPLTLIKGPLEKVISNTKEIHNKNELSIAKKYTGKLQILINNLLTISKLESGKMKLIASEVNIVKLVGNYIQAFESLAKQKGIKLSFKATQDDIPKTLNDVPNSESGEEEIGASPSPKRKRDVILKTLNDVPNSESGEEEIGASPSPEGKRDVIPPLWIDREKFEQILNNLLSNAFKFTEEGGVIEVEICSPQSAVHSPQSTVGSPLSDDDNEMTADCQLPTADSGGQCVGIKISDTGRGLDPDHLPHIFDRFYQAGQKDNSYYEGTGIGLALTKELVELHHGKIEVESEQGKGSTFTLLLPLGNDHLKPDEIVVEKPDEVISTTVLPTLPKNHEELISVEKSIQENNENHPILLIVEDNADMRSYIREYFENEFQIIEAGDGADGYKKSTEHIPDIIISDVMMPNMDGVEFCKKVKTDERTSHIPVVLLTARASKESRIEGLETGADDFITKPFDGDELKVRVNNLIDQRKRLSAVLERKIQKSSSTAKLDFEDLGITSMDDTFLQKARVVVDENLSNSEYTIEDFASAMALSRSQLHRKLKALINSTGSEFLRTIRMNYALELLQKKAGTISEIAYDVGFNSPTYFSQLFKQTFGMSPTEYQNNVES